LQCAEGSIHFGTGHQGVEIFRSEPGWDEKHDLDRRPLKQPAWGNSQQGVIASFAEAIRTGTPAMTSGQDNLQTIAAVFAGVKSSETGQPVVVKDLLTQ